MSDTVKYQFITTGWNNVLSFVQRSAEPILFSTVMFQIATMLPFPSIPNANVQNIIANIILVLGSITFLGQQIVLDIAGASIIKRQKKWTKEKVFGFILVGTTIFSVSLSVLVKMDIITVDIQNNAENILIIFRAVLAVLYGSLVDLTEQTPTPPGVQMVPAAQTFVQVNQTIKIPTKSQIPKSLFSLYAITEEDNVVQSEKIEETVQPSEQDNFIQGKSYLRILAPTAQTQEVAQPSEQEKNTEELPTFKPRKKKKEWTADKDLMLNEIMERNQKATARDIAQICDCSPTTANAKKNLWKEEHKQNQIATM